LVPYHNSILTAGIEYNQEEVNSSRFSEGLASISNNVLYAEDEWNIGVGTLAIGGRYSANSVFGSFFTPRISAVIPVTNNTMLRASYGRGYREPSLLELYIDFDHSTVGYIVRGAPNLKPEDSHGFNLGMQYNREDLVWFRVTYFYNRLNNLIDYYFSGSSNGAAVLTYRNVEQATTQGVDFDLDLGVTDRCVISLGYNLVDARDGYGNPLPFRTPHSANLKLNYELPFYATKLDLRVRWYDTKPVNDDQTNRGIYSQGQAPIFSYVNAYSVTDVRVSSKPFSGVELFAGISNLFDYRDYPFGQIKPLQVFGGVSLVFK
jgi:outer membrane receptor for ferrienterochelin and colicins